MTNMRDDEDIRGIDYPLPGRMHVTRFQHGRPFSLMPDKPEGYQHIQFSIETDSLAMAWQVIDDLTKYVQDRV
jgi:hypothetical protein